MKVETVPAYDDILLLLVLILLHYFLLSDCDLIRAAFPYLALTQQGLVGFAEVARAGCFDKEGWSRQSLKCAEIAIVYCVRIKYFPLPIFRRQSDSWVTDLPIWLTRQMGEEQFCNVFILVLAGHAVNYRIFQTVLSSTYQFIIIKYHTEMFVFFCVSLVMSIFTFGTQLTSMNVCTYPP